MSSFKKATREKLRLRMGLAGPSGSGKSVTALRLAQALAQRGTGRIAVIDTEHRSARKYVGETFGDDMPPLEFEVIELTSFAPTEYTGLIEEAGRAGFDALVIDSLSHAWEGKDGALELKDDIAKKSRSHNDWAAWRDVTPMHRRMVEALLQSPCHVIATMRSKTEWCTETNKDGKQVPVKIGLAPIQRQGMEYEFDLFGDIDQSHVMTVTKSRCKAVDGLHVVKPGKAFLLPVIEWLEKGQAGVAPIVAARVSDKLLAELVDLTYKLSVPPDRLQKQLRTQYQVDVLADLHQDQGEQLAGRLRSQWARKNGSSQAASPVATAGAQEQQPSPAPANGKPAEPAQPVATSNTSYQPADSIPIPKSTDSAEPTRPVATSNTPHQFVGSVPKSTDPEFSNQLTDDQDSQIRLLLHELEPFGLTKDRWRELLRKVWQIDSQRGLTIATAEEAISRLKAKLKACRSQEAATKGGVQATAEAKS